MALNIMPSVEFFDAVLAQQMPALSARLQFLDITSDLFLTPWILALFSRSLPLSTTCRIWDRLLSEGEAAIFRAALALMLRLQPILLVVGFEEAIHLLQNLPIQGPDEADASARASDAARASDGRPPTRPPPTHLLAEAELLATMSRVQLPEELYEALLLRSILHGS